MLRIGVIGEASELVKLCASIEAIEEVHFIGFHSVDELGFENTHARFTSIEELLLATDSVYVSSKAASREGVLEKAIRGQIHTLVEFPFIIDSEVASDLMNLAHEASIKLQVGNPLKFTPVYLGIKDKFDTPMFIESHQLQSLTTALTDTSVIQNLMIKDIDLILSIVKSKVKKISANGVAVVNGTPDITNARIEFDNGCVANLTSSRISFNPMHKMRFFQRNSYINVDFVSNEAHMFSLKEVSKSKKPEFTLNLGSSGDKEVIYQQPKFDVSNPVQEEVKLFIQSIEDNTDNDLTIPKALYSIEIAQKVAQKVQAVAKMIE